MASAPTPNRRLTTGHDPQTGRSIFLSDMMLAPTNPLDPSSTAALPPAVPGFTLIHKTRNFPDDSVNDSSPVDHHGTRMPLTDDTGVTCRIVDFPPLPPGAPDEVNFMHRTQSVDFGVVLKGKIVCALDSGEEKEVGVGDVVVQRGTNHAWRNISGEPGRMMFVLVPSVPIQNKATGEVLEPTDTRHLTTEEGARELVAKLTAAGKGT